MVIHIDTRTAPASVALEAAADFKSFHICLHGINEAAFEAAAARIGSVADRDHVFVDRVALEGLAGEAARDPEWQRSLDAMLQYAASKGWVDANGAPRAHVVRESDGTSA
jgi:hypothetical protein